MLATLFWSGNFVVGQAAVASITPLDLGWLGIGLGLLGVLTRGDPQRVLSFSINTGEL